MRIIPKGTSPHSKDITVGLWVKYLLQSQVLPLDGTKCISNSWRCREREREEVQRVCKPVIGYLCCLMHWHASADGD